MGFGRTLRPYRSGQRTGALDRAYLPAGAQVPISYLAGLYNADMVTKAPRLQGFPPIGCLIDGSLLITGDGQCTFASVQNLPWIAFPVEVEQTPPKE